MSKDPRTDDQHLLASEASFEGHMTYIQIAHETMSFIAKRLLGQTRTLQEASEVRGFAVTGSFGRAFKQWSGRSPRAYCEATHCGERADSAKRALLNRASGPMPMSAHARWL